MTWIKSTTKNGRTNYSYVFGFNRINVIVLNNNKLYIIYKNNKEYYNRTITESNKKVVLQEVLNYVCEKYNIELPRLYQTYDFISEIGRREEIKTNKEINKFGDGYNISDD